MPGGPLCVIGPLSAIKTTSVFSATPSLFRSSIKLPIKRTRSGHAVRFSCAARPFPKYRLPVGLVFGH